MPRRGAFAGEGIREPVEDVSWNGITAGSAEAHNRDADSAEGHVAARRPHSRGGRNKAVMRSRTIVSRIRPGIAVVTWTLPPKYRHGNPSASRPPA